MSGLKSKPWKDSDLALKLGRTIVSVVVRRGRLGIPIFEPETRLWTPGRVHTRQRRMR